VRLKVRSIEKSSDLIGNLSRDLPTCSIMPQPTTPSSLKMEIVKCNQVKVSHTKFKIYLWKGLTGYVDKSIYRLM
jgi:hypothetical protein